MKDSDVAIGVAVASSTDTRSSLVKAANDATSSGNLLVSSSHNTKVTRGYVSAAQLDVLRESLSERDWRVLRDVASLRLATSTQLEALCFGELADVSRAVVRRRVLGRLVKCRVLGTLPRRIGGVRAGSAGLVFFVDTSGRRLLANEGVVRQASPPGERYIRHVLAVSQLYVGLAELARTSEFELDKFQAEPASWWPDGRGGLMKPDAYVRVMSSGNIDSYWCEVDLATEHLPTLKRKLMTYLDFYQRGRVGPGGIMPWVLVTVPDDKRCSEIVRIISQLPPHEDGLFSVVVHNDAAAAIMRRLQQS